METATPVAAFHTRGRGTKTTGTASPRREKARHSDGLLAAPAQASEQMMPCVRRESRCPKSFEQVHVGDRDRQAGADDRNVVVFAQTSDAVAVEERDRGTPHGRRFSRAPEST